MPRIIKATQFLRSFGYKYYVVYKHKTQYAKNLIHAIYYWIVI